MSSYWTDCISESFDDAGISATKEQIENVVAWVTVAHENHGLATGDDIARANFKSDEEMELKALKSEIEKRRIWKCSTKPCHICHTSGQVIDGWGRGRVCDYCNGEGRAR